MPDMDAARSWLTNPSAADGGESRRESEVSIRESTKFFQGRVVPATRSYVDKTVKTYGGFNGGILLEDSARGIGNVSDIQYDATLNALIINERNLYFSPVSPRNLAVICRAIAADDRLGVSIGEVPVINGKEGREVPDISEVAIDMQLADRFLANIALGRREWIEDDYRFVNDYSPVAAEGSWVYQANLNGFTFENDRDVIRLKAANFDLRVIPMSNKRAPNGSFLADEEAMDRGFVSPFDSNMEHIKRFIGEYRIQKAYIDRVFQYGEVAALLRALKADEVDLDELANLVEQTTGIGPFKNGPSANELRAPISQLFVAWDKLDPELFLAQWTRNAVRYTKTKQENFSELSASRRQLFSHLRGARVIQYEPIYYKFENGTAFFYNSYRLMYLDENGDMHGPAGGCEIYEVVADQGNWRIAKNLDNQSCDPDLRY